MLRGWIGLVVALVIGTTATGAFAQAIHSVRPMPAIAGLPQATPAQLEEAKTFHPGAPCPGVPTSASRLIEAGVYKSPDCVLQGDRFEYWQDDLNGQFLLILPAREKMTDAVNAEIKLERVNGGKNFQAAAETMPDPKSNKLSFLISMTALQPGNYRVSANYIGRDGKPVGPVAEYSFTKVAKSNPVVMIPADGIPIVLEKQDILPDAIWPVRTGVPMPINSVMDPGRLALFENGQPVAAQITPVATWCPEGPTQWVHVNFIGRYVQGKPADYRLKLMPAAPAAVATPLKCEQTPEKITVDTGFVRFEVSRAKFAGIETAWYDPSGAGKYDDATPVIKGAGGPYLVDGRMIRFDASADKTPSVVVEENGPVRVTILATGWYTNAAGKVDPNCQYITRITACAGQPMLRVSQHTILTYDTRIGRLADVGFQIASPLGENFTLGADGASREGALPAAPQTVFLHQDRYDHFRLVGVDKTPIEGKVSDGWFTLRSGAAEKPALTVMLRDIWQKFPKEVEMSREGLTLHFWPKHGVRAFNHEDELTPANIYKFWCFHEGGLLDLNLPDDYFDKFRNEYAAGTFECRPEQALNGNGQGLAIANEFAILFSQPTDVASTPKRAELFQRDPTATATPEWNAASGAMGKMAAADRTHFADMEEAIEQGNLSHNRCVERANEYGMWNYADTHTYWNVKENHAELHRVWHNSHYHEVSMNWLLYYRTGSPDLLRWARKSTDHFMNVDTINYADPKEPLLYHVVGAQYHCKSLTHWGGEMQGMKAQDNHASVASHFIDPDAFLWDWYLTGDPRARDVYKLWADSYTQAPWYEGVNREACTTMAYMMTYYASSWDANMLPAIRGLGLSLRTQKPLEQQTPGPTWHPLWINRYYERTRDPEYRDFILKYGRMPALENSWSIALAALAYDLSKDKSYLTMHLGGVSSYPHKFYRAPGDAYDWYGAGPGPLGTSWGDFQWGYLLSALHDAGINSPVPEKAPGAYPWTAHKLVVMALKKEDKPFNLRMRAVSFGGDLHPIDWTAFSPSGKQVAAYKFKGGGPSSMDVTIPVPADGETGLYRIEVNTHQASVSRPLTDLPMEVALVPNDTRLIAQQMGNYLLPLGNTTDPVTFTVDSESDWYSCDFSISDAAGKVLGKGSLFRPRNTKPAVVTLDPAKDKLPWKIETYGHTGIKITGKCDTYLMADSPEMLQQMAEVLGKKNEGKTP